MGKRSVSLACHDCGVILPDHRRQHGEGCLPDYQ